MKTINLELIKIDTNVARFVEYSDSNKKHVKNVFESPINDSGDQAETLINFYYGHNENQMISLNNGSEFSARYPWDEVFYALKDL